MMRRWDEVSLIIQGFISLRTKMLVSNHPMTIHGISDQRSKILRTTTSGGFNASLRCQKEPWQLFPGHMSPRYLFAFFTRFGSDGQLAAENPNLTVTVIKSPNLLTHVIAFDIKGAICHLAQAIVVLAAATSHFRSFRAIWTCRCCYQSLLTRFFTSSKVLLSWV